MSEKEKEFYKQVREDLSRFAKLLKEQKERLESVEKKVNKIRYEVISSATWDALINRVEKIEQELEKNDAVSSILRKGMKTILHNKMRKDKREGHFALFNEVILGLALDSLEKNELTRMSKPVKEANHISSKETFFCPLCETENLTTLDINNQFVCIHCHCKTKPKEKDPLPNSKEGFKIGLPDMTTCYDPKFPANCNDHICMDFQGCEVGKRINEYIDKFCVPRSELSDWKDFRQKINEIIDGRTGAKEDEVKLLEIYNYVEEVNELGGLFCNECKNDPLFTSERKIIEGEIKSSIVQDLNIYIERFRNCVCTDNSGEKWVSINLFHTVLDNFEDWVIEMKKSMKFGDND